MRLCALIVLSALAATLSSGSEAQSPFTLQQVLSAPYASNLTAAPKGALFAWVEDAEGRHNLYVGGADQPARALTHNTEDDGQDITELAWAPDGSAIAYTYGAESGADGKPANPAHLQRATPVEVMVQPLAADAKAVKLGEGRAPLFDTLNHQIFFLRSGQIWTAELGAVCLSEGGGCALDVPPANIHQLVFDRGSASSLTLSSDGHTLAFISSRREVNEPSHRFLALFDFASHTLTFPAPSTSNDSAPVFSPDGKSVAWLRSPFTQTPEFAPDRVSATPWSIQVLDLATRVSRTVYMPEANKLGSVLPHMATGAPRLFYTAGKAIIFASEADGFVHLYALDLNSPKGPTLLTPGSFEVEDATVDFGDGTIYYASNEEGDSALNADRRHIWKVNGSGQAKAVVGATRLGIETYPQINHGVLAALLSDNMYPMHPAVWQDGYWLFLHPIGAASIDYPDRVLVTPTQVLFHSSDNLLLHGQLFLPGELQSFRFRSASLQGTKTQIPSGNDNKKGTAVGGSGNGNLRGQAVVALGDGKQKGTAAVDSGDGNQRGQAAVGPGNDNLRGQAVVALRNDNKKGTAAVDSGQSKAQEPQVKHPAILFLHGGPRRQMLLGYPSGEYYSNAYAMNQYLTSLGFIVLSVNYRCGIGYGLEFRQCVHAGADGAAEYADVLAAQKYLASRADVDASRIGVWGGSYGGYLTALALARNSDLFAAGVDFHGVHDWNLEDNAGDWLVGTAPEKAAIAAKALASSPLADVSHWTSPVLLIHGDNDPEVAYAETAILADKLRGQQAPVEQHAPVEELIFPDEVHGFLLHKDWLAAYEAAAAFFVRTLKP